MNHDHRMTFRLAPDDTTAIAKIATRMQQQAGQVFVSRSDVLRHALRTTAALPTEAQPTRTRRGSQPSAPGTAP